MCIRSVGGEALGRTKKFKIQHTSSTPVPPNHQLQQLSSESYFAASDMICNRCTRSLLRSSARRCFSQQTSQHVDIQTSNPANDALPAPVIEQAPTTPKTEVKERLKGSRRRRTLIAQLGSNAVSFERMPYQCFQEARKVLQQDRAEKLEEIAVRRARIQRLQEQPTEPQDERHKERRLRSMRQGLDELKIYADINDPLIKKKFEDGQGDLSKPIYRFLADRKWREYKRKILMQRIEQMHVVPDVLPPPCNPTLSTNISFGRVKVQHGEIVDSGITEKAPAIRIQPYDQGIRLVTIAVINPDVPNVEADNFDYRCHFLACNVPISPTSTYVDLSKLDGDQVLQTWLPPHCQKGLDYQRHAVLIFEQPAKENAASSESRSESLNVSEIREAGKLTQRSLHARALLSRLTRLKLVGIDLFRSKYDNNTAAVMTRAGLPGATVEFKRKRIDPLPYKRMSSARYR